MSTPVSVDSNAAGRASDLGSEPGRQAAYRRLTAAILGLDVNTLAIEMRAKRLGIAMDDLLLAA